jgi:hypothetical protein
MLLLVPSAAASPVPVQVAPGAPSKAVQVLVDGAAGLRATNCNDAGSAPDDAPDGRWTCAPLDANNGEHVAVLRDGHLLDAGTWTAGPALIVVIDGKTATVGSDAGALPDPVPGTPAGPGFAALIRVEGLAADAPSPVVRLAGAAGSADITCHDDGGFPDKVRNDGNPGCLGVAPDAKVDVAINGAGTEALGNVAWTDASPLRFLVIDATGAHPPDTTPFVASLAPAADTSTASTASSPPPPTDTPAPADGTTAAPSEAAPAPTETVATTPVTVPSSTAATSTDSGSDLCWPAAVLALGVAIAGGTTWFRSRSPAGGLPEGLVRHDPGPLFPGGPVPVGAARAWRAVDPGRLMEDIVRALAVTQRVLLVTPPEWPVVPIPGGPVYIYGGKDRSPDAVKRAARALRDIPGTPVAVVVLGSGSLEWKLPNDPFQALAAVLPDDVWSALVLLPGESSPLATEEVPQV